MTVFQTVPPFRIARVLQAASSTKSAQSRHRTLVLAPMLEPLPGGITIGSLGPAFGWAIMTGGLWWGLSMAGLMWATARLEPARVGILLMTEVLVGAMSAAWFAGEHLAHLEIAGGVLVLLSGVLEVWPVRRSTYGHSI